MAQSASPLGPFKWVGIEHPNGLFSMDMTEYVDPNDPKQQVLNTPLSFMVLILETRGWHWRRLIWLSVFSRHGLFVPPSAGSLSVYLSV